MLDLHLAWERLTNVAIAGVARQEMPAIVGDDAVGQFCSGITANERPAQFLNTAGTVALCRMAGTLPVQDSASPPAPAVEESQPYCSPQAARLLRLALSDPHLTAVLPEWIAYVTHHGQVIPPELLPDVLTAMSKSSDLRQRFLSLIGERGYWLAHLNAEWQLCVQATTAEECRKTWETGSRPERVAALRTLRSIDPAGARALFEEARPSEPLDTLAALIPALEVHLTAADEPLLESLLDDKRKTIRRPAADLLARLADTEYQRRMLARIREWIAVTPARPGTLLPPRPRQPLKVEVALPLEYKAEWTRDAIEETPPQGIGAKSWWLQQMVAAMPLSCWETAGECTPKDLIAAVSASEHKVLLLRGWLQAAERQRNLPWIIALLQPGEPGRPLTSMVEVFAALSATEREQVLLALVTADAKHARALLPDLLRLCSEPWGAVLSDLLMKFSFGAIEPRLFEPLAYYLHPRYLEACRAKWQQIAPTSEGAFEARIRSVMQFREDLYHTVEEGL